MAILNARLNAVELDETADAIMLVDGDRDHMNQSRLTCGQTQTIAKFLRALAAARRDELNK